MLVVGASAVLKQARLHPAKYPWVAQLLARRPAKVVMVALANKMARIAQRQRRVFDAGAVLSKGEVYRAPALAASP